MSDTVSKSYKEVNEKETKNHAFSRRCFDERAEIQPSRMVKRIRLNYFITIAEPKKDTNVQKEPREKI